MNFSRSPLAPENLVSQDGFGRPVPRQPAHSPHSGRIWSLLTGFLPISAAASIDLYRQPPSGQSRVYRVTQLRTDGVHRALEITRCGSIETTIPYHAIPYRCAREGVGMLKRIVLGNPEGAMRRGRGGKEGERVDRQRTERYPGV